MLMCVGHAEVKEEKLREGHGLNLLPFRNMNLHFMVLEFYKLKKYITNNSSFTTLSFTWHFLIKIIQVNGCHHDNFYGTRFLKRWQTSNYISNSDRTQIISTKDDIEPFFPIKLIAYLAFFFWKIVKYTPKVRVIWILHPEI